MKKFLTTIALLMTVIVLALTFMMIKKADGYKAETSQLRARNGILEIDIIEKQKQIKDLKFEITGLNQQIENTTIKYQADEMYIQDLESATLHMAAYITLVNLTMKDNGIIIPKFIYGYVDENTGEVIKN